jgi:hypothetical protein
MISGQVSFRGSGAPSGSAKAGTYYQDDDTGEIYINLDGSTSWKLVYQEKVTVVSSTPYDILASDDIVIVDTDTIGETATVNLPLAANNPRKRFTIKNRGGTYEVTVARSGSDTIEGADADYTVPTTEGGRFLSDGTDDWLILYWYQQPPLP